MSLIEDTKSDGTYSREELDALGCDNPECNHAEHNAIVLHSKCHNEGLRVAYVKGSGTLIVSCHVCDKFVAAINVA